MSGDTGSDLAGGDAAVPVEYVRYIWVYKFKKERNEKDPEKD